MFVLKPPKKLLFLTSAHKLTKKEEQAHYHLVVACEYTDEAHICAQNGEVGLRLLAAAARDVDFAMF